jgi:diguanylate cyclase (GGDEF)-like protein
MSQEQEYPTHQYIDGLTSQSFDLRHQNTRKALELCLQAKELSLKIDYQIGYAKSLYLVGLCHHILGTPKDVIETVLQSLSLFQSLGDERGQADAYNLLGTVHARESSFSESIEYHHKSLAIRRKIGDKDGEAGSLNNIGIDYTEMAQFSDAFEYLYNSLNVAQSIPSPAASSYAVFNIANIFIAIGDLEKAREYFIQGLEFNKGTNDHALDSSILAELGKVYALLKDHDTAIAHLKHSLEITQRTGNLHDQGITLTNMGMAYQENGQYLQAEEHLNAALDIMKTVNARTNQSEILCLLGKNYLKQEKFDEAIALLYESLKIAEEINVNSQTWNAHSLLAEVYKTIGDFEQALDHYHIYHNLWKNYYSQDSERRIHAIIAQAEIEQARRDAEEHRKKSHQLSQALTKAKRSENEKTKMLNQLELQSRILEQLTREDGLTGLSNRRWLDIQINQEFERARRFNHPLSIAIMDIDNFKSVNDQYSHLVGDEVLRQVAKILRSSCRVVDCVGRYGGEEFLIILVETKIEQAEELCNKIINNVRTFTWQTIHPSLKKITLSIGVSQNLQLQTPAEMIAIADGQLYRAKQQGKDRICIPEK